MRTRLNTWNDMTFNLTFLQPGRCADVICRWICGISPNCYGLWGITSRMVRRGRLVVRGVDDLFGMAGFWCHACGR